jgi:hypothetical protein
MAMKMFYINRSVPLKTSNNSGLLDQDIDYNISICGFSAKLPALRINLVGWESG